MLTITTLALLSGFAAPSFDSRLPALAQDKQDDQARKIDELIRQLGADEFAVREKASEELKKIGKGAAQTAEAESIAKFVADHQELAEKFGITEDGIAYGGSRVSFNGGLQGIPLPPRVFAWPVPEERQRDLRCDGARFEKVSEEL